MPLLLSWGPRGEVHDEELVADARDIRGLLQARGLKKRRVALPELALETFREGP